GMLADDHALVDLFLRADEELAALFEVPERVGDADPVLHGNQHADAAALDRALVRRPAVGDAVEDAGAAGVGQELAVVADEPARGHMGDDTGLADARGLHLDELALPLAGELVDDDAGVVVVDVDDNLLDRFQPLAVLLPEDHARPGDAELEPLAAHV